LFKGVFSYVSFRFKAIFEPEFKITLLHFHNAKPVEWYLLGTPKEHVSNRIKIIDLSF